MIKSPIAVPLQSSLSGTSSSLPNPASVTVLRQVLCSSCLYNIGTQFDSRFPEFCGVFYLTVPWHFSHSSWLAQLLCSFPPAVSWMAQYEAQLQRARWYLESYISFVALKVTLGGIYISLGNVRLQHDLRTLREQMNARHERMSNSCKSK